MRLCFDASRFKRSRKLGISSFSTTLSKKALCFSVMLVPIENRSYSLNSEEACSVVSVQWWCLLARK